MTLDKSTNKLQKNIKVSKTITKKKSQSTDLTFNKDTPKTKNSNISAQSTTSIQTQYIPQIDIGAILKGDFSSQKAKKVIDQIFVACRDVGFFTIFNHGISEKQIEGILQQTKNFVNLQKEQKMQYASKKWNPSSKNVYRGYFPSEVNGKEGYDFGDYKLTKERAEVYETDLMEENVYPSELKDFKQTVNDYYDSLDNLGLLLMKAVAISLNVDENFFQNSLRRPDATSTLRLNYYPNQEQPVEISVQDGVALGCETHTDSGFLTILYQDKVGGLQVQNRHTKLWYDVPFDRRAFVINTGDALQAVSRNKLMATYHRVLWNKHERISIPYFMAPSLDYIIDTKMLFPDEEYLIKPTTWKNFFKNKLKFFKEYNKVEIK